MVLSLQRNSRVGVDGWKMEAQCGRGPWPNWPNRIAADSESTSPAGWERMKMSSDVEGDQPSRALPEPTGERALQKLDYTRMSVMEPDKFGQAETLTSR